MSSDMIITPSNQLQMFRIRKCLNRHFEQRRKQLLVPLIEHCNSLATAKQIWSKLTPDEKNDKEIVYKLLSFTDVFGSTPWNEEDRAARQFRQEAVLSQSFLDDPGAVLAFFASNNRSFCSEFRVSLGMRDNKQVMEAVCDKIPFTLEDASDELRDDFDVVLGKILGEIDFDWISNTRRNYVDDPLFMLKLCQSDPASFEQASARLRSDPVFVRQVLANSHDGSFIAYTTDTFQVENLDIIVGAIGRGLNEPRDLQWNQHWSRRLSRGVWHHKQIIMACLRKEWLILEHVASIDANNPHLSDEEVIRLAVENNPDDFKHASVPLRRDGEFVLSLVSEFDCVLHHAPEMKTDKDILAAAMARSAGTISDCFVSCFQLDNDFEFLCGFAGKLRSGIRLYDLFRLSCLDQGTETVAALQAQIAAFADVPLGTGAESLQAALANLETFGF